MNIYIYIYIFLKKTTSVLWKLRQKKKKIKDNPIEGKLKRPHIKPVGPMDHDFMHIQVSEWLLYFIEKIKAQGL